MPNTDSSESDCCGFPSDRPFGYGPGEPDLDGAVRAREGISEADLGKAVAAGTRVVRVVLVELASTAKLAPFVRLSDRPGWQPIGLRRYEGPKTWGDVRAIRKMLAEHGYRGRLLLVPQGDPFLRLVGIE